MLNLPITLTAASILALIYFVLSVLVARARFSEKASIGDKSTVTQGGREGDPLQVAVRRHGNFAEYVPFSLLLIALLEGMGANRTIVMGLAIALVVGRGLHPLGLGKPSPNVFRGGGIILQWLMLLVAGGYGLMLVLAR